VESAIQATAGESVRAIPLPPRSPNLNAYAERWARSVKEECLSKLILFGDGSLRRALRHYEVHYHEERNHQGKRELASFFLADSTSQQETGRSAVSGAG
jgi:hypothetical protein